MTIGMKFVALGLGAAGALAALAPSSAKPSESRSRTFYAYCVDGDKTNVISEFFRVDAKVDEPELRSGHELLGWKPNDSKLAAMFTQAVAKHVGDPGNTQTKFCRGWTDQAKAEENYRQAVEAIKEQARQIIIIAFAPERRPAVPSKDKGQTYYGYCWSHRDFNIASSFFSFEGPKGNADRIVSLSPPDPQSTKGFEWLAAQWKAAHSDGLCEAWPDRAIAQESYESHKKQFPRIRIIAFTPKTGGSGSIGSKPKDHAESAASDASPTETKKSPAQLAVEEAAKRRTEREAAFQAKQAEYERQLAEQKRQVEAYKKAQAEVERKKAAQEAAAEQAVADYQNKMAAHSETIRQHDAEVAKYEQKLAARKIVSDLDERNGLKAKESASTDDDANVCVTTAEVRENASFKGNTAASIVNGCGKPVDVRICLMTESKGWNCGVSFGVAPQASWSHSSFNATGQVFVDARVSNSSRPLASPN